MCGNHMDLKKRLDILEETVRNLQIECQRLYQTGFSNGVEVARKEYSDELKRLEDMGFISTHGFLRDKTADDKADAIFKQLGVKIEKGTSIVFDKSPTDEDWVKAQELIDNENKE